METVRIRGPGWKKSDPGPGINIPEPPHCIHLNCFLWKNYFSRRDAFVTCRSTMKHFERIFGLRKNDIILVPSTSSFFLLDQEINGGISRGRIQRKTMCMGPCAGVDYNLTLRRLQSRLYTLLWATTSLWQNRFYFPCSQGLWIWPQRSFAAFILASISSRIAPDP